MDDLPIGGIKLDTWGSLSVKTADRAFSLHVAAPCLHSVSIGSPELSLE